MTIRVLKEKLSVCKLDSLEGVDFGRGLLFLAKTRDELSLVCESACVPSQAMAVEKNWRAFRVEGVLDFGLVGVLADITRILAAGGVSVFAVSTYDTDYVMVKEDVFGDGLRLLGEQGYTVK